METPQINITLGTAGHIDHGKTALVRLLTGCETDRLKEEKERGMSIELGFAPCTIAGKEVGIVDVPGHEHFIKTMVAGATGIDAVVLVVAADDGVMPQTREHLDILTLLGIGHGVVALTKIDRVDGDRIESVKEQIHDLLGGTFLDGASILPISNVTGEGFDGFYAGLTELVHSIEPRSASGVFRLPVERAFSVKGYGTVISGIPVAGRVGVGDDVVLLPANLTGRVNAVQVYGRDAQDARAGQCAAINVRHWDHRLIERGSVLTVAGYFAPHQWYLCRMRALPNDNAALKNGANIKLHTGTSEVPATIYLLEADAMRPGDEGFVQIRLDRPVTAGPGDRFIARRLSPPATIGGGRIIESEEHKLRRNRPDLHKELEERAGAVADEKSFVEYAIRKAPGNAAGTADTARRAKVTQARLKELLAALEAEGKVRQLGQGLYAHEDAVTREGQRLTAILAEHHRTSPEAAGMPQEGLLEASGMAKAFFDGLLRTLKEAGTVGELRGLVSLAAHKATLSEADRKLVAALESLFRARLFSPPSIEEAAATARLALHEAQKGIKILKEGGALVEIAPGMYFCGEAVERAKAAVTAHIEKEGKLESVKFKYLIDTTRKYAIPLLDYFDKMGVTLRVGNTRYLKGR